jgi:hypothetical protein
MRPKLRKDQFSWCGWTKLPPNVLSQWITTEDRRKRGGNSPSVYAPQSTFSLSCLYVPNFFATGFSVG